MHHRYSNNGVSPVEDHSVPNQCICEDYTYVGSPSWLITSAG